MNEGKRIKLLLRCVSYVVVAAIAVAVTQAYYNGVQKDEDKLDKLRGMIDTQFIGRADRTAMEDAAASAMVSATGDQWSYYIPASEFAANQENLDNSFVGIGVTIAMREDGTGADVQQVEAGGGAKEAGIVPGDIITAIEDSPISELGISGAKNLIRGEVGTQVSVTILREGKTQEIHITRKMIRVQVATGEMLEDGIGLVRIVNFNDRCAEETISQIRQLQSQGATKLIFDVRFNPGGYKEELVNLLDYLLPKGEVFRSLYYDGRETVNTSDASCLEMPMAVLINGSSYSAAEFFAAALEEYDWAITVGEPTVGKSYFQQTLPLGDGSAVALSVGKYVTPKGVTLAEVGGLQPEIEVVVDNETAAKIYRGTLSPAEDTQIQAAVEALLRGN